MMKNQFVIIYSTIELVNGNSAGSNRMLNYARAISKNSNVILISQERDKNISTNTLIEIENNIYTVGIKNTQNKYIRKLLYPINTISFLLRINSLIMKIANKKSISLILYPSTKTLLDIFSAIYLIKLKKYRVFYEANEIRFFSANLYMEADNNLQILINNYLKFKYHITINYTRYYTGLICISRNIENYFKKYNPNILRIPILANYVDNEFSLNKKFRKGDVFKLGFFGSINYYKENLEMFIKSLNKWKLDSNVNFIVDFYGTMDSLTDKKLSLILKKFNLDKNVHYKGTLNQKDVLLYMSQYHLLVLPRGNTMQNKYGFSTKLSEYLISKTPCLITDVSDNALYIKDNVNGFIVPPDDMISFANKLNYIYNNYENLYISISKNAVKTVKQHFSYYLYSNNFNNFLCGQN